MYGEGGFYKYGCCVGSLAFHVQFIKSNFLNLKIPKKKKVYRKMKDFKLHRTLV